MPKIEKWPLVGMRGSLGGFTFYEYKGSTYARNKKKNSTENSYLHLKKHSNKMRALSVLHKSLKNSVIETIFRIEARRLNLHSGYNLFIKMNTKAFDEHLKIGDFSFLSLSAGNLDIPFRMEKEDDANGMLKLRWILNDSMSLAEGNHVLQVAVIYDNDFYKVSIPDIPTIRRRDSSAVIDLRKENTSEAHVYCFFTNVNRDSFSESVYFNLKF